MKMMMYEKLKDSIGKIILIYLKDNSFRYEGKLTNVDETYLEILDFKTNSYKIISISELKDLEVKNEKS